MPLSPTPCTGLSETLKASEVTLVLPNKKPRSLETLASLGTRRVPEGTAQRYWREVRAEAQSPKRQFGGNPEPQPSVLPDAGP